jgi:glycerol dehydrogenase
VRFASAAPGPNRFVSGDRPEVSLLRVAPAETVRGDGAVEEMVARLVVRLRREGGERTILLVHGEVGYPAVRLRLDAALEGHDVAVVRALHQGPCHQEAIDAVARAATEANASWLLGVGGGRVLDVAKGAAYASAAKVAALPTSPATCAATAPTVVVYDVDGGHLEARDGGPSADLVALDAALLASAPDRLLASGIVDAWAKVHEVRLTSGRAAERSASARAALSLLEDLAGLLEARGEAAIAAGPENVERAEPSHDRRVVAEAVVSYPGLVGGLAGPEAKLALAHPLHDALTRVPGSHAALHGEKVGFGSLVQILLAGRDGLGTTPGERRTAMRDEAARYARLGFPCHLEALGCGALREPGPASVAIDQTLADPSVRQAFPELGAEELGAAIAAVDAEVRELVGTDPRA